MTFLAGGPLALRPVAEEGWRTEEVRAALRRAGDWLRRHQEPDGRWDCAAHGGEIESRRNGLAVGGSEADRRRFTALGFDVGVTGLALLALAGAGGEEDGQEAARRAAAWLVERQDPVTGRWPGTHFSQGLATLALLAFQEADCAGNWRGPAQRGLDCLVRAQNPQGGWNYHDAPRLECRGATGEAFVLEFPLGGQLRSDTSLAGWIILALQAGRRGGFAVPGESLARVERYLGAACGGQERLAADEEGPVFYGALFPASPEEHVRWLSGLVTPAGPDGAPGRACGEAAIAAIAGLGFLANGWRPDQPFLARLRQSLIQEGPAADNFFQDYFAGCFLNAGGGEEAASWNSAVARQLLAAQVAGEEGDGGSWAPDATWGRTGGRVYATALGMLLLELPGEAGESVTAGGR